METLSNGLIVGDRPAFEAKSAHFAEVGANGLYLVFDFDRTLTVKQPGSNDDVTTWHILREHLPDAGKQSYDQLFQRYRNLELDGSMTQADAETWWSETLNLFVTHAINLAEVENDFLSKASVRPGTAELFAWCAAHDVPTVILSAGMRDVIEIWCRKYQIAPTVILSTALELDDRQTIVGWQQDTLVHVLNKSEATHSELASIRASRSNALAIGDSLNDADMVAGDQNVLRIRLLDPRGDESANAADQRKTLERFDAFITSGTLLPVRKLLQQFVSR